MERIGPYTIEGELGRGAFGAVWRARGPDGRAVAVKLLLDDDPDAAARFRLEAALGRKLDHPALVRTLDQGEHDGRPWLAMELVLGPSLDARLREVGRLPPAEAADVVARVARGVAHAHDRGVLHRDIKPANVLLAADGPKLADFGLGRDRSLAQLTRTGDLLGSPAFMSPEQLDGRRDLDARVDVYALGVLLYRCLAGRLPYAEATIEATEALIRAGRPPSIRAVSPGVPPGLEAVCLKAFAPGREARHASAAALAEELERFAPGAPPAEPTSRAPLALAIGGGAALGLLVVLAVASSRGPAPPAATEAPPATAPATAPPGPPPAPEAAAAIESTLAPWRARDGGWVRTRLAPWRDALATHRAGLPPGATTTRALVDALDGLADAAEVGRRRGLRADAVAAIERAATAADRVAPAWGPLVRLEVARLAFDRGRYELARQQARLVAEGPGRPAREAAYVDVMAGRWLGSTRGSAFWTVHHADPHGVAGLKAALNGLRLGRRELPPGAPTDALAVRTEALKLDPDDVDVLVVFALAANGGALTREALVAVDRALELAPDHARGHYVRGLVLYMLRRPEDALEAIAWSIVLMGVETPQLDIGQQLARIAKGPGLADRLAAIARAQPQAERDWLLGLLPN